MNKKAFGLASVLVVLFIVSSLSFITILNYKEVDVNKYLFINNYLYTQSKAISERSDENVECHEAGHSISFNKDGKVNMAQTVSFNNGDVVIHLGSGYITYE